MKKLRIKRRSADYDPWYMDGSADVGADAEYALLEAGDIIAKIDAIKTGKN